MILRSLFMRCCLVGAVAVAGWATTASADWDPTDGHKMHFPQMPNPNGWDVDITRGFVADDWQCSQTGPVSDIHFWYSWQGGAVDAISAVWVRIWDDDRTSAPYSQPGNLLWDRLFTTGFTSRFAGTGQQGWYTPGPWMPGGQPIINPVDHTEYYQLNLAGIVDPFVQQQGKIYWLELHVVPLEPSGTYAGWKTSLDHFEDDAVFEVDQSYFELFDPIAQPPESLDMAFVITPEPASLALLAIGGVAAVRRRR